MITKKVYLTIDDIPSKDFIGKVDFLSEKNIQAVLFCIGNNLINREDDMIYAIKKGYILGNHSFNHEHFSEISLDECKNSIRKTDELIEAIYKKSGIQRPMKLFRFPYFDLGGNMKTELQTFLKELGYAQPDFQGINMKFFENRNPLADIDVRCTFDQMEYYFGDNNAPNGIGKEEMILKRIEEDAPYEGKALNCTETNDLILIHDHEKTTKLFYKIINRYLEKNFEFLRL